MFHWLGCEVEIRGIRPEFCDKYKGIPTMQDFRSAISQSVGLLANNSADMAGKQQERFYCFALEVHSEEYHCANTNMLFCIHFYCLSIKSTHHSLGSKSMFLLFVFVFCLVFCCLFSFLFFILVRGGC